MRLRSNNLSARDIAVGILLLTCAGCATTINQSTASQSVQVSTTIDVSLTTQELLAEMLALLGQLSDSMQIQDRVTATQQLSLVTQYQKELGQRLLQVNTQLAADFNRICELATSAVVSNRPADVDKALRFLPLVIAAVTQT